MQFGKITETDLKKYWQCEASQFTPWLANNLSKLSEILEKELELEATEVSAGSFTVDIVARDLSTNTKVAIENQFGQSDHKHLGQVITYATVLGAGIVIWIADEFRMEHKVAIDFLNQNLGERLRIYAIEGKIITIDDSKPAFVLNVACAPSEPVSSTDNLPNEASELKIKYKTFFQELIDELREKHKFTNAKSGQPQNWYTFASENSKVYKYSTSFALGGRVRVEVYLECGDKQRNETLFDCLKERQQIIEKEFGASLSWERLDDRQGCRIANYREGDIHADSETLGQIQEWIIDQLKQFKSVFPEHIRACSSK
jgi:hypothetical protein